MRDVGLQLGKVTDPFRAAEFSPISRENANDSVGPGRGLKETRRVAASLQDSGKGDTREAPAQPDVQEALTKLSVRGSQDRVRHRIEVQ